jgi:NAD(P)-dependent dehydrogenase (short-subunit alcohol dehydrogenase family)
LLVATQEEQIERVLQTNLMGTIWACQIVAKSMMRRKKGCIVNISSLLGVKGGKGSAAYAASKAGILGLQALSVCSLTMSHLKTVSQV